MDKIETFELFNELMEEGYKNQAPSNEVADMDTEVCKESECSSCEHIGLKYKAFTKGEKYRAFSVCPNCGESEEF